MQHICYLAKQLITAAHVGKLGFDFWQMHNTAITKWWRLITGFQPSSSAGVKELLSQRYNLSITFQLLRALLVTWLQYHAIIWNVLSLSSSNTTRNIELSTAGSGTWLLEAAAGLRIFHVDTAWTFPNSDTCVDPWAAGQTCSEHLIGNP